MFKGLVMIGVVIISYKCEINPGKN